ncbi:hypothetical protein ACFFSW_05390 [Saccharothrix longispora]|uniref:Secreted protein n=1 Tax=Saccharothrix longispora TaxID=33920 RepID=A0ABU1PRW6_9PSEU|nr:hypothetical protein [Saccharothrix longispora]MDR6593181.1 hypothetical protein [Saccharothrix longispora]
MPTAPSPAWRALLVATTAAAALVAAPASASAVTCSAKANATQSGATIVGRGYTVCRGVSGGEPVTIYDDEVAVQRLDPNTGVWHVLATGVGTATYPCAGTVTNTFRAVTPERTSLPVTASCG